MIAFVQAADPALVAELQQMNTTLIIIAVGVALFGLLCLGLLFVVLRVMGPISRLTSKIETQVDLIAPRAAPILDKVNGVAFSANDVADKVRKQVSELMETAEHVNRSLRDAVHEAEIRVREIGAVIDVVKAEAEEVMLDTAATARGLHVTAAALRREAPRGRLPADGARTVVRQSRTMPAATEPAPVPAPGDGQEG